MLSCMGEQQRAHAAATNVSATKHAVGTALAVRQSGARSSGELAKGDITGTSAWQDGVVRARCRACGGPRATRASRCPCRGTLLTPLCRPSWAPWPWTRDRRTSSPELPHRRQGARKGRGPRARARLHVQRWCQRCAVVRGQCGHEEGCHACRRRCPALRTLQQLQQQAAPPPQPIAALGVVRRREAADVARAVAAVAAPPVAALAARGVLPPQAPSRRARGAWLPSRVT